MRCCTRSSRHERTKCRICRRPHHRRTLQQRSVCSSLRLAVRLRLHANARCFDAAVMKAGLLNRGQRSKVYATFSRRLSTARSLHPCTFAHVSTLTTVRRRVCHPGLTATAFQRSCPLAFPYIRRIFQWRRLQTHPHTWRTFVRTQTSRPLRFWSWRKQQFWASRI